jgi:hypothetical protein
MATTLRKLTKPEWDEVRSLATTVTSYDPSTSPIKGQTTVQIIQQAITDIQAGNLKAAQDTLGRLVLREAYNTFIGVESKKRRRN